MSIKEKATEIKAQDALVSESFFRLDEPVRAGLSRLAMLGIGAVLLVSSVASYGLGYHAGKGQEPLERIPMTYVVPQDANRSGSVQGNETPTASSTPIGNDTRAAVAKEGMYVGSRKGTKYHLTTCPGAKTISEENKIWFASKEEAHASGYSPAANCKDI